MAIFLNIEEKGEGTIDTHSIESATLQMITINENSATISTKIGLNQD